MGVKLQLAVEDSIFARHPELSAGGFIAAGLGCLPAALTGALERQALDLPSRAPGSLEALIADERIVRWREAIRQCGLKPSDFRGSVEQLLRRALADKPAHSQHPLVAAYCAISMRFVVPLGAYDIARLPHSGIRLRLARPSEDTFCPLGGQAERMPLSERIAVYAAGSTVLCYAYNFRDSEATGVQGDTDVAVFMGEVLSRPEHEALRSSLVALARLLADAGAEVGPIVLASQQHPTVELTVGR